MGAGWPGAGSTVSAALGRDWALGTLVEAKDSFPGLMLIPGSGERGFG